MEEAVISVSWNPNPKLFLIAAVVGRNVILLSPESFLVDKTVINQTNAVFKNPVDQGDYIVPDRIKSAVEWRQATEEEWSRGYRLILEHFKEVKSVSING